MGTFFEAPEGEQASERERWILSLPVVGDAKITAHELARDDVRQAIMTAAAKQMVVLDEAGACSLPNDPEQAMVLTPAVEAQPKKLLRKPTDGTLKFQAGEARSHPALHAAMSQMAALLRVAKEREQCMAEFEKFHEETFEDLEAERDGWKREVLMLSQQVSDLRRGLQ
ncbi:unnamed protein product, partial [Effrenium voratum]